jgi:hypothetical protein
MESTERHADCPDLRRWEDEGGQPSPPAPEPAPARPFEEAVFEALSFDASQVIKVDVSIGKRSQSVTFKFALTTEQVAQLDAMASGTPNHA